MPMKNSNDISRKGVGESGTTHQLLADFKKVYDSLRGIYMPYSSRVWYAREIK
jgi:hypothetical protein